MNPKLKELQEKHVRDLANGVYDTPSAGIKTAQNRGAKESRKAMRKGSDKEDTRKTAMTSSVKNSAGTPPIRDNRLTETQSEYISKYSHRSASELTRQPQSVEYLIKGLIKRKGLHMLFGESGCGK